MNVLDVAVVVGILAVAGIVIKVIVGRRKSTKREVQEKASFPYENYRQLRQAAVDNLRRHQAEGERFRAEMSALGQEALGLFESMPEELASAEQWLNQAEVDFEERAFVPFWDSIEKAANSLARYDECVRGIKNRLSRYTEMVFRWQGTPVQFPLARQSMERLSVGATSAERMKAIVRAAQRDFQFASIYEQRKTNQILVEGFTNLAQALDSMTWQISGSIDDLNSSMGESMRRIEYRVGGVRDMIREAASEEEARQIKALKMLDNIQRGRRPFP